MNLRPIILGVFVGTVYAIVEFLGPHGISDELRLVAYVAILILISAPFLQSTQLGIVCGVVVVFTQTILEVAYYGSNSALGVVGAASVFLSSLPSGIGSPSFEYRLAYLAAGALAAYVGRKI